MISLRYLEITFYFNHSVSSPIFPFAPLSVAVVF